MLELILDNNLTGQSFGKIRLIHFGKFIWHVSYISCELNERVVRGTGRQSTQRLRASRKRGVGVGWRTSRGRGVEQDGGHLAGTLRGHPGGGVRCGTDNTTHAYHPTQHMHITKTKQHTCVKNIPL